MTIQNARIESSHHCKGTTDAKTISVSEKLLYAAYFFLATLSKTCINKTLMLDLFYHHLFNVNFI